MKILADNHALLLVLFMPTTYCETFMSNIDFLNAPMHRYCREYEKYIISPLSKIYLISSLTVVTRGSGRLKEPKRQ